MCVYREIDYIRNLELRFLAKVNKTSTCWLWVAYTNEWGYGKIAVKKENGMRTMYSAHRLSYELYKGPIPKGKCVLHKCDIPACVNPDHLFLGSPKDNTQDMCRKGRHVKAGTHCGKDKIRGENNPQNKLTARQIHEIRWLYKHLHISQVSLAKKYNVSNQHISDIINRKRWAHLE